MRLTQSIEGKGGDEGCGREELKNRGEGEGCGGGEGCCLLDVVVTSLHAPRSEFRRFPGRVLPRPVQTLADGNLCDAVIGNGDGFDLNGDYCDGNCDCCSLCYDSITASRPFCY